MAKKEEAVLEGEVATQEKPAKKKRVRKLSKSIEGNILTIKEHTTDTVTDYDFSTLPEGVQAMLGPYGLSSKLGDSAAGKKGQDAVDAINKVWNGLMDGNWTVRAPAAEKISKNSILSRYEAMEEGAEKDATKMALIGLGIMKE
jgi:hypothetical protein